MSEKVIERPTEPKYRVKQLSLLRKDYESRIENSRGDDIVIYDFRIMILDHILEDGQAIYSEVVEEVNRLHSNHSLSDYHFEQEWDVIKNYVEDSGESLITWGKGSLNDRYPPETLT